MLGGSFPCGYIMWNWDSGISFRHSSHPGGGWCRSVRWTDQARRGFDAIRKALVIESLGSRINSPIFAFRSSED